MVKAQSVAAGLTSFIDKEVLPKVGGWQRWALGAAAGLAARRADAVLEAVKSHPAARALGIVDGDGNIDDDAVFEELARQAEQSPAVIAIPMLGDLTLTARDLESLRRHIRDADARA